MKGVNCVVIVVIVIVKYIFSVRLAFLNFLNLAILERNLERILRHTNSVNTLQIKRSLSKFQL